MRPCDLAAWLLTNLFFVVTPTFTQPVKLVTPLTVRWNYVSDSLTELTPAGDVDAIYAPVLPGELVSLGSDDGLLRWKADIGGNISSTPIFDSQRVYILSESQPFADGTGKTFGVVRAVSRSSGVTSWVKEFPRPFRRGLSASPVSLFASLDDGRFYSIDKLTGETRWMVQFPHPLVAAPILGGDQLYALTSDGYLVLLNQRTGKVLQRYRTEGAVLLQASTQHGLLYLGTGDGYILALGDQRGKFSMLWRRRVGTGLQDITATQEGVLVTASDNFVLLLESRRGNRLWKRQMPARLAASPALGNGNAIFAPLGEDACIALSLRDGKVINSLPLGKDNGVVATPLLVGDLVFIPTRKGLLAFAPAGKPPTPQSQPPAD
ncbi:MAG TPA: PQQ-binding-like beta-propeller repeat protein [Pyrinomonadaceae bacterium]|jgi:outer membrane protein assembly factor BamB